MFRKSISFGMPLLVAAIVVFARPSSVEAQYRGGFGGGRFGGYQGRFRDGGNHAFYERSHFPSYGYYYNPDYYTPYYYPSYYYSNFDPAYSNGRYIAPADPYGVTLAAPPPPSSTYQPDFAPESVASITLPADTRAHMTVHVPADAKVWFDGTPTTTTGTAREFQSPALTAGSQYSYEIKASWTKDGRAMTQTQTVAVTAGGRVSLSFPAPAQKAEAPSPASQ